MNNKEFEIIQIPIENFNDKIIYYMDENLTFATTLRFLENNLTLDSWIRYLSQEDFNSNMVYDLKEIWFTSNLQ